MWKGWEIDTDGSFVVGHEGVVAIKVKYIIIVHAPR